MTTRRPRLCCLSYCGRPHFGRGFCQAHYRQERAGEVLRPIRGEDKPPHACAVHPAGTSTCYEQAHCRCRPCTDAKSRTRKRIRAGLRRLVDPAGTRRRLQALAALGWDDQAIAALLEVGPHRVSALRRIDVPIRQDTAAAVAAAYDQLSMTLPPDTWQARRNRSTAAAKGYAPPLAWDDDHGPHGIDNPDAQPYRDHTPGKRSYSHTVDEIETLIGTDSADQIAARLGYADYQNLATILTRSGQKQLADRLKSTKEVA